MTEKKTTTEAQQRATNAYRQKNKKRTQYLNQRSATKRFITANATDEDILLVKEWLSERQKAEPTEITAEAIQEYINSLSQSELQWLELEAKKRRLYLRDQEDKQQLQEEKRTVNSEIKMDLPEPD